MATYRGTANGAADLYAKIIQFMTSNGWVIMRQGTDEGNGDTAWNYKGVWLRGTDYAGDGQCYVHMQYRYHIRNDQFAFCFEGAAGWDPTVTDAINFGLHPHNSYRDFDISGGITTTIYLPLHRNPIEYYINVNPRRIVGGFYHNARWASLYAGLFLPYGTFDQYPLPFYIAACNITTPAYQTNTGGCCYGASNVNSGMLFSPDGRWWPGPYGTGSGRSANYRMMPWYMPSIFMYGEAPSYRNGRYSCPNTPIEDRNAREFYALSPAILYATEPSPGLVGVYGELDGLYHCPAWGASGGDIITTIDNHLAVIIQREVSTDAETAAAILID